MSSHAERIFSILRSNDFIQDHFQRKALHLQGEPERYGDLFSWQQLNAVLNSSQHPHPKMKMSGQGRQFKPKTAGELIHATRNGATLIVENIDRYDLTLGFFLSSFGELLDEETRLNMYLSYPDKQGYKIHYDTHDFFILQVYGYKRWFIFPATTDSVLFDQKHHDAVPPLEDTKYMECVLGPGDLLYVPRGHWHYALAEKEPSLHLTLAMFIKTGIDVLKWVADELTESELFRRSLPVLSGSSGIDEHLRLLGGVLSGYMNTPGLYDRFVEYKRAAHRDRAPFNFPFHSDSSLDACRVATAFSRRSQAASIMFDSDSGRVRLACSGRLSLFEKEAETTLRFIYSQSSFTKKELLSADPSLTWETISMILARLVIEGYCSVEE